MDPDRYPEPMAFKPERFMHHRLSSAQLAATFDENARDHFAFGWGRRVCQGMHIAEASLNIIFARLAWCFDIQSPSGTVPPSIDDESSFLGGFVSQTRPFLAHFIPRDPYVRLVLSHACDEAQTYWSSKGMEQDSPQIVVQ